MAAARASRLCPSNSRLFRDAWLPGNSTCALVRLAWNNRPGSGGPQRHGSVDAHTGVSFKGTAASYEDTIIKVLLPDRSLVISWIFTSISNQGWLSDAL